MVGKIMPPKDIHILTPSNCEYVDYTAKIKTADGINIAHHLTLHLEN